MAELTQKDWLTSDERKRFEKRIIYPALPLIKVVSSLAIATIQQLEPDHNPLSYEKRALIPGEWYSVTKIGNRGPAGHRDRSRRVSELFSVMMVDELPHITEVLLDRASLVGPRGTIPEHRERLFDCLGDGKSVDEWRTILECQQPGLISTYGLEVHSRPGSGISYDDESYLTDAQVALEAADRFAADSHDYYNASRQHDRNLHKQFIKMVLSRATNSVKGSLYGTTSS
ncbi:sugar transferase [Candidatus Saccharibacteria bacterium]|nr:sugar transferase [Candidatus Saccharibacteria bacterium]